MKRTLVKIASLLLFVAIIYLTAVYLNDAQSKNPDELGFMTVGAEVNNLWPMVYNGLAMLLGIIFGFFYNRFTDLRKQGVEKVNIGAELKGMFTSTNFYLSLAAAPIVFGIVIIAGKGVSLSASLFLAFQNGFFWQNIMPKANVPVPVPGQHSTLPAQAPQQPSDSH